MNHRIKALASEADEFCREELSVWTEKDFQQKFAELIIAECCYAAQPNDQIINDIQKRFMK